MKEGKSRQALYIFLAIVLSIVLIYVLMIPGFKRLSDVSIKAAARKNDLQTGRQKVADLKTAAATLSQKNQAVEALNIAVPPDKDTADAIVQVSQMVSAAGLKVQSIQPSAESESAVGQLPLTVLVQGQFPDLVKFSELAEKNLRPVKIVSINIATADEEGGSELSASYSIQMVYYLAGEVDNAAEGTAEEGQNES